MEVDGTNGHGELNEVSLQRESPCTVDPKALDENGGDLSFTSTFSPDGQVAALAELCKFNSEFTFYFFRNLNLNFDNLIGETKTYGGKVYANIL